MAAGFVHGVWLVATVLTMRPHDVKIVSCEERTAASAAGSTLPGTPRPYVNATVQYSNDSAFRSASLIDDTPNDFRCGMPSARVHISPLRPNRAYFSTIPQLGNLVISGLLLGVGYLMFRGNRTKFTL